MKARNLVGLFPLLLLSVSALAQIAPCSFSQFDVPNSEFTSITGIANNGTLAGAYGDANGGRHGFVFEHGVLINVDVPGAIFGQEVNDMNNSEVLVGDFADGAGSMASSGIMAALPFSISRARPSRLEQRASTIAE
jgi:hypothetical protein